MHIINRLAKGASLAAVLTLGAGFSGAAHAGGFYLQEQSVKGAGRAFSGEVADQGAASLWWNPAAIGGMTGGDAHFGVSAILPKGDVRNINTLIVPPVASGPIPPVLQPTPLFIPVGGAQNAHNPIRKGVAPSGAIAYALNPRLAVGLALTAPYNFTTDYAADSWVRYTADKTKLRTIDIQPSIAFMATDALSIGVGLNIEYADASLSNYLPGPSPIQPLDWHQELKGDGWDLGWSAGAQYRSGPVSLGVSYKSSIEHELKGTLSIESFSLNLAPGPVFPGNIPSQMVTPVSTSTPARATFRTPWQLIFGGRFAVTPELTLNMQATRFGWAKFDTINLGAPLNTAIPEHYRNTWALAAGVDYAVSPQWDVRAGIARDQTPTRNGERDARVPDSNRWNFSAGTSYALSRSITLDAAAAYIAFDDADIDRATAAHAGTPAQTLILVDGRLENTHAVVLSLGGRFAF